MASWWFCIWTLHCGSLFFSEPALAFTHSPGCMFVTDKEDTATSSTSPMDKPSECPLTFCISQNPLHYSIASKATVQQIRQLEEIAVEDPGEHPLWLDITSKSGRYWKCDLISSHGKKIQRSWYIFSMWIAACGLCMHVVWCQGTVQNTHRGLQRIERK